MKKFLYMAFIRPHEPVWRLVAMVPALCLTIANEVLDLALAIKRNPAQEPVDVDQAPAIEAKPPAPEETPPRN
jgi:hypothetical protein